MSWCYQLNRAGFENKLLLSSGMAHGGSRGQGLAPGWDTGALKEGLPLSAATDTESCAWSRVMQRECPCQVGSAEEDTAEMHTQP